MFEQVYSQLPAELEAQKQYLLDYLKTGEITDHGGKFPL
jgi:hypothetical protein